MYSSRVSVFKELCEYFSDCRVVGACADRSVTCSSVPHVGGAPNCRRFAGAIAGTGAWEIPADGAFATGRGLSFSFLAAWIFRSAGPPVSHGAAPYLPGISAQPEHGFRPRIEGLPDASDPCCRRSGRSGQRYHPAAAPVRRGIACGGGTPVAPCRRRGNGGCARSGGIAGDNAGPDTSAAHPATRSNGQAVASLSMVAQANGCVRAGGCRLPQFYLASLIPQWYS